MKRSNPTSRRRAAGFRIFLILLVNLCGFRGVFAADVPLPAASEVFELLLKLGLPDSKGATWMKARGRPIRGGCLPDESHGTDYSGNTWLVHEDSDGMVDVIVDQSRRVHCHRRIPEKTKADIYDTEPPEIECLPADLEADIHLFEARVELYANGSLADGKFHDAPTSILFLSHLYRQGHVEAACRLLPKVLALVKSPNMALDGAISLLAFDAIYRLNDEWIRGLPADAFADKMEALTDRFPRHGSPMRKVALAIARKAREQKPAAEAEDPEVKPLAELLLHANERQTRELFLTSNWLLPSANDDFWSEQTINRARAGWTIPQSTTDGMPSSGYFASVFGGKVKSALALSRLLEDHRLLRALDWDTAFHDSLFSEEERYELDKQEANSPVNPKRNGLDDIPHPIDIGKLAWRFLEPIVPHRLAGGYYGGSEELQNQSIRAWLQTIASFSDEEIAWNYVETADNWNEENFDLALKYLVARGGEESVSRLRSLFLDPAVWKNRGVDSLLPMLEVFVKRHGATPEFREGIRQNAANKNEEPAMLAKLALATTPRTLGDLLAEAESKNSVDSVSFIQSIFREIRFVPWVEAEPQIYRAAARAKDPGMKSYLLAGLLQSGRMRRSSESSAISNISALDDPSTQAALVSLLTDERLGKARIDFEEADRLSVADLTAIGIAQRRLAPDTFVEWNKLRETSSRLAFRWLKMFAGEILAKRPPPPAPNASRISSAEVESLIQDLGALQSASVLHSFQQQPIDKQFAVMTALADRRSWPAALQQAQLLVTEVCTSEPVAVDQEMEHWKGRGFDVSLFHDLLAYAEQSARGGRCINITIIPKAPLDGLVLEFVKWWPMEKSTFESIRLPGRDKFPTPSVITQCKLRRNQRDQAEVNLNYARLNWKDAKLNETWQKLRSGTESTEGTIDGESTTTDVRPLEDTLNDIDEHDVVGDRSFYLGILSQTAPQESK